MSQPHGIVLKASDFQVKGAKVYINKNKTNSVPGMLLIFADFCGHCHKFLPTFNNISDNIGREFCCASVENEALKNQSELVSALNFEGFPTICFFNQDGLIISQYNGNRDKESILDTICKTYHHCYKK